MILLGGGGEAEQGRELPAASTLWPSAQDFVEVCKREGGDHEEKGVDRLLGLGSSRCVARGVDSAQVAQMEVRPD